MPVVVIVEAMVAAGAVVVVPVLVLVLNYNETWLSEWRLCFAIDGLRIGTVRPPTDTSS
jgi:hypothetical protein